MCLFPKSTCNCCSPDCSWAISWSGPSHWGSPSAARQFWVIFYEASLVLVLAAFALLNKHERMGLQGLKALCGSAATLLLVKSGSLEVAHAERVIGCCS